jgi:dipeptidyl-peptidase-4
LDDLVPSADMPSADVPAATDPTAAEPALSFPRQQARTARFTRGAPRGFQISADGERVWFLRSSSGTDPAAALWVLDLAADPPTERRVADPETLLAGAAEDVPPEERARRERAREGGAGIVAYALDRGGRRATFALSSRLFVTDADGGESRELPTAGPVVDPRLDPTGRRVAYAANGGLHVVDVDGSHGRVLADPAGPRITWGLAEFVAGEEMGRYRGFWWAPDGERLLVAQVDTSPVQIWHIADPANPDRPPVEHAYPKAGTPNADVRLWVVGLAGARTEVAWDRAAYEYLTTVSWTGAGIVIGVQPRDQRSVRLLRVDPDSGVTELLAEDRDEVWVELVDGSPTWCGQRLVRAADVDGWRRLVVGDEVVTPDALQVRSIVSASDDEVIFTGSEEPIEVHLWRYRPATGLEQLTTARGVHGGVAEAGTLVIVTAELGAALPRVTVRRGDAEVATIATLAEQPAVLPRPTFLRAGDHDVCTAVLLPTGHAGGSATLPVILDPYGGPHGQRVQAQDGIFRVSQWLADQGFAVVVADGRGTPGRGSAFERAIHGDFATAVLEDQIAALRAAAESFPQLDLGRVGITGWSFGGYLAALAVLRRPDVFHAAVAGAPVTDFGLYDTHYTERYLGHPDTAPEAYERSSLLPLAPGLQRPLMLIHGLADDNVVAAHTLRLSALLTAAGRPHTVLPLSGVTHMTPQEEVAENLMLLQVDFLRRALAA